MFPTDFSLRLIFLFPEDFHFQGQAGNGKNPNIHKIERHTILMEQSRRLGHGLVGRAGEGQRKHSPRGASNYSTHSQDSGDGRSLLI